jgi:hypothetical protein
MSLITDRLTHLPSRNGHEGWPEGLWRQQPDHVDEWYKIRPIDYEYRDRLFDKYSRMNRSNTRELKGSRAEEFWKDLLEYLIEDWEIYEDAEKTRPVPCTRETRYGLYIQYKTRTDWVWDESVLLKEDDEVRQHAERDSFRRVHPTPNGAPAGLSAMPDVVREG